MKNPKLIHILAVLGIFLFLSQSVSEVFSFVLPEENLSSVESVLNFDRVIYLPLIMNDTNPVPNGNFELGRVSWSESSSTSGAVLILNNGFPAGISPHDGSWAAWLGQFIFFPIDESITQTVFIPHERTRLHFWYWISSVEPNPTVDYFKVFVHSVDPVVTLPLFTGSQTGGWVEYSLDLSAYAGESVIMIFHVHDDWDDASWIFLDDISLQNN